MTNFLTVTIPLPYRLRLKDLPRLSYSDIDIDDKLSELSDAKIIIKFLESESQNTILQIKLELEKEIDSRLVGKFVSTECRKIVNLIIKSYQSVTGSWSNAGLISPIGTSYLQINSRIEVNGEIINAQAFQFVNTFLLNSSEQIQVFEHIVGKKALNLPKVYFTIARELQERGNYSLSYVQTVRAIEAAITEFIVKKMQISKSSVKEITDYKNCSLGKKLKNFKISDPQRLDTHLGSYQNWGVIYTNLDRMRDKRNKIIHHSDDASKDESLQAITNGKEFFSMLDLF